MKTFEPFVLDPWQCRKELDELSARLGARDEPPEHLDFLPWFRHRKHLSAFVGAYFPYLANPDQLAYEYDLFGDFRCDLAIGDSVSGEYCFVAFGDTRARDWPDRFDHGYGRILDWFWKLNDTRGTNESLRRFGPQYSGYQGLLIAGSDANLGGEEKKRLEWRREHIVADGKHVHCVTYDELYRHLDLKLRLYEPAYRADLKQYSNRSTIL